MAYICHTKGHEANVTISAFLLFIFDFGVLCCSWVVIVFHSELMCFYETVLKGLLSKLRPWLVDKKLCWWPRKYILSSCRPTSYGYLIHSSDNGSFYLTHLLIGVFEPPFGSYLVREAGVLGEYALYIWSWIYFWPKKHENFS